MLSNSGNSGENKAGNLHHYFGEERFYTHMHIHPYGWDELVE